MSKRRTKNVCGNCELCITCTCDGYLTGISDATILDNASPATITEESVSRRSVGAVVGFYIHVG
jgi:hypothetical protein